MKTYRLRPLHLISMENDMSNFTYRLNFGVELDLPVFCCDATPSPLRRVGVRLGLFSHLLLDGTQARRELSDN